MDGVSGLPVPTFVIALTNRRELVDPAVLRPGRLEVHVAVGKPDAKGRAARLSLTRSSSESAVQKWTPASLLVAETVEKTRRFEEETERLQQTLEQLQARARARGAPRPSGSTRLTPPSPRARRPPRCRTPPTRLGSAGSRARPTARSTSR